MEPIAASVIERTKNWIREIVIGLNFCPFARKPFKDELILYKVEDTSDRSIALESLIGTCNYLEENPAMETALLIFPNGFSDFEEYLDLVDLSEKLLKAEGFEGVYQVASFHPNYIFAGSNEDDPANYTNRSPYPMLHLLREDLLEIAIDKHANVDDIPNQNIAKAQSLGLEYFKKMKF
ncbi:MAG: hypothetical protein RLZZ520_704 [Bacteroidota bacterium]|jgi:hypothetical protein